MDENLGLAVLGTAHVEYFPDPILGVQFGVIRCKFPMLRFSKGHYSNRFHSISTKLINKLVMGEYKLFLFLRDLPKT